MDLGEKLRCARLEAGMSQRQLCGEEITRNMLSQIEHGTAKPSVSTLQYLAARLGKPVSFFLEETVLHSPNQDVITTARRLYDAGNYAAAGTVLAEYQEPDGIYDRERQMLEILLLLSLAEEAIQAGREPYARTLLERTGELGKAAPYYSQELERRRLLLLGRIPGQKVCGALPSLDEELLLRAQGALMSGETKRAVHLLDAAENHAAPRWNVLRGECYLAEKDYENAARCYQVAEEACPKETAEKLEICYRELGDFKRAYEYACKRKR